jgi:hypothetical protein
MFDRESLHVLCVVVECEAEYAKHVYSNGVLCTS